MAKDKGRHWLQAMIRSEKIGYVKGLGLKTLDLCVQAVLRVNYGNQLPIKVYDHIVSFIDWYALTIFDGLPQYLPQPDWEALFQTTGAGSPRPGQRTDTQSFTLNTYSAPVAYMIGTEPQQATPAVTQYEQAETMSTSIDQTSVAGSPEMNICLRKIPIVTHQHDTSDQNNTSEQQKNTTEQEQTSVIQVQPTLVQPTPQDRPTIEEILAILLGSRTWEPRIGEAAQPDPLVDLDTITDYTERLKIYQDAGQEREVARREITAIALRKTNILQDAKPSAEQAVRLHGELRGYHQRLLEERACQVTQEIAQRGAQAVIDHIEAAEEEQVKNEYRNTAFQHAAQEGVLDQVHRIGEYRRRRAEIRAEADARRAETKRRRESFRLSLP